MDKVITILSSKEYISKVFRCVSISSTGLSPPHSLPHILRPPVSSHLQYCSCIVRFFGFFIYITLKRNVNCNTCVFVYIYKRLATRNEIVFLIWRSNVQLHADLNANYPVKQVLWVVKGAQSPVSLFVLRTELWCIREVDMMYEKIRVHRHYVRSFQYFSLIRFFKSFYVDKRRFPPIVAD